MTGRGGKRCCTACIIETSDSSYERSGRWPLRLNRTLFQLPLLIADSLNKVHALRRPAMQGQRSNPQQVNHFGTETYLT